MPFFGNMVRYRLTTQIDTVALRVTVTLYRRHQCGEMRRARRALSGEGRAASGVQRGAEEWARECRVREKAGPTGYASTRVKDALR